MKKRFLSAFLLACALVIAPAGNIFSTVAAAARGTVSGNVYYSHGYRGELYRPEYMVINGYLPNVYGTRFSKPTMTAIEALQEISEKYSANELNGSIITQPATAQSLEQLGIAAGYPKAGVEVSPEVSGISNVSVRLAELNADSADTAVTLKIAAPAQSADLGGRTGIQADFSLDGVADNHNLKFPVLITMSVPEGLPQDNMDNIQILHYVNGVDAEPVDVRFTISNGMISFNATSFSLFAFVEAQYDNPDEPADADTDSNDTNNNGDTNNDDNTNNNGDTSNNDDHSGTPAEQGVKDSVPKTDDTTIPVLPFAAAGAVCAAAVFAMKKNEQK